MNAPALSAVIEGIGYWSRGLPDWTAARAYAQGGDAVDAAPGVERALAFGAQQVLAQHRGLWALLESRAAAREPN